MMKASFVIILDFLIFNFTVSPIALCANDVTQPHEY